MTKLTLTYVASKPQVSARTNKPYTSQSIKTAEYGERYLSGFESKETAHWKVGDVVEVEVTEADKMDKNGKPYLNWKLPKTEDKNETRFAAIEFSIANIHRKIDEIVKHIKVKEDDFKQPDFSGNRTEEEITRDMENMKRASAEAIKPYKTEAQSLEESLEAEFDRM